MAQGGDQWRALVNTVMDIRFPYDAANLFTGPATIRFSKTVLLEIDTYCTYVLGRSIEFMHVSAYERFIFEIFFL